MAIGSRTKAAPAAPGTTAAAVAVVLLAALLVATVRLAPRAAAASAGTNLLVNPGAETGECSPNGQQGVTIPGWTITSGMPNIVCYGTAGGYPTSSTPGSPTRGNAFFTGGATGNASMQQTIDVSSASAAIDQGGVTYSLSGWLGGYASQNDDAAVVATFYGASNNTLATQQIGPVLASDRNNTTEFLDKQATGAVPAQTRTIKVEVDYTWSAGNTTDGYVDDLSLSLSTTVTAATLSRPPSSVPQFDHVFFVFMENQNAQYESIEPNAGYIYANSQAPYINNTLIPMGTKLANLYGTTHPSDPNYLAVAGGSVSGQTANPSPGAVNATNLADRLEAAGKSWKGYNEGAHGTCDLTTHGYTYPDDEPFTLYNNIADNSSRCNAHIDPLSQLSTDLASTSTTPSFSWVAANDYNDMESGGIAAGDTWLSNNLPTIFNSPAWTQQKSLLIVAWDEGYTKSFGPDYPNQVSGVVIGSQGTVAAGATSSVRYTDYSLGRTIEDALGVSPLTANDTYAVPVNDAWKGGSNSPSTLSTTTPTVTNGSSVTYTYSTPAATSSSTNWIGIYAPGTSPGNGSSVAWQYAAGTSGSVTFTANYGAGTYQVYYLYNNGDTVLAGPDALTLTSTSPPTLTTNTPSVKNGSSITFNYSTPASTNSSTNWVGIYTNGTTPGNQSSRAWQYATGTSGSVTFTANYGKGTYHVYYLYNNGYTILAGPITITLT